jgi:hypothetical protein
MRATLTMLTLALAVVPSSMNTPVPLIWPLSQSAAPAPLAAGTPSTPMQLVQPPLPPVAVAPVQVARAAIQTTGQIWECTMDGQKTFSNNPCGEKSSLRVLGPINTMESARILAPARAYQAPSRYGEDIGYQGTQDQPDDSSQGAVGVPVYVHRIAERTHRPSRHDHGRTSRRY